jgi:nitrogen fixation protein FixH
MNAPLSGRKVFAMFATGFGIIIAVNLTMAFNAVGTFPGVETRNSYTASQNFQEKRANQQALGWTSQARLFYGAEGPELVLDLRGPDGRPVDDAVLTGTLGRATNVAYDVHPQFAFDGAVWRAPVDVPTDGNWDLRLSGTAGDGTPFRKRLKLRFE